MASTHGSSNQGLEPSGVAVATAAALRLVAGDPRRLAVHQLLGGVAGDGGRVAGAGAVLAVLPGAGAGGERDRDHVGGDGDPGHVRPAGELRRLGADDEVRDRDPDVRRHATRSRASSSGRGWWRTRGRWTPAGRCGPGCWSASGRRSFSSVCSFWLARRAGNVRNALGSFGRSSARRYQPSGDRVTFADVAGIDEAKQELTEVVDFLRNPDKYVRLGGRIPRGVLLSGPPGTGKTLLARALAGEANVPFFSMAASEFVEAIVGVGAARVRDLFKQAKAEPSAIIFIDELDAVGRSRTSAVAGFSGGNDEREQTLNQILTEMDGFDSSTKVIVVGATNRPEVLDRGPAPARPVRPPRHGAATRPQRPSADPRRAHPWGAARRGRRPGRDRRLDAGNGRRRSGQPGQRGHVARGATQPRPGHRTRTSATPSRRSSSAPNARC